MNGTCFGISTINYGFYPASLEYPGSTSLSFDTARAMIWEQGALHRDALELKGKGRACGDIIPVESETSE